ADAARRHLQSGGSAVRLDCGGGPALDPVELELRNGARRATPAGEHRLAEAPRGAERGVHRDPTEGRGVGDGVCNSYRAEHANTEDARRICGSEPLRLDECCAFYRPDYGGWRAMGRDPRLRRDAVGDDDLAGDRAEPAATAAGTHAGIPDVSLR